MRSFQAVLAASLRVDSSGRAQLLPAGEFAARDGRPGPGRKWKLGDAAGLAVAAALSATAAATPVVIDYDHQTLHAQKNGQQAPAAGWIEGATWLSGQGLFADVRWTAAAKARIEADEYRFISPVITFTEDGTVTGVALAALCNYPAILGMEPVVAHLSTQFQQESAAMNPTLTALIAALGLAGTATEAEAFTALTALRGELATLKARPALPVALGSALGLAAGADEAAALSAVAVLKSTDAGTLQMVTALQGQVAALTTQLNESALTALVDGAIAGSKFAPAHRDWLLAQGRKDMAALQAAIAAAPVIPGLAGQSKGREPGESQAALSADAARLQAGFGLTAEQFAKGAPAKA